MTTVRIRVPLNLMKWIRKKFVPLFDKQWHFKPTDTQLIIHVIKSYMVYETGQEIEVVFDEKQKKLRYR